MQVLDEGSPQKTRGNAEQPQPELAGLQEYGENQVS